VTPSQAKAALETAFRLGWGSTTPIAWGNTTPPMPDGPWVRFTTIHGESRLRSWSGTTANYDRRGICFVQIFVPLGTGTRLASDLALQAMDILEGKTFGLLETGTASMLEVGQGDDAKDQTQVRVTFWYDEQKAF
jgi:hypothetical protein